MRVKGQIIDTAYYQREYPLLSSLEQNLMFPRALPHLQRDTKEAEDTKDGKALAETKHTRNLTPSQPRLPQNVLHY